MNFYPERDHSAHAAKDISLNRMQSGLAEKIKE